MNLTMPRENLEEIFDQIIREITKQAVGIELHRSKNALDGELFTVYIAFEKGFRTSLSLCAERSVFVQFARYMMQQEDIGYQDMEAVAKEYFNVLCGHIAARLFQKVKIPARFSVPAFYVGRYAPKDYSEHIVLTYSSSENENVQLVHYVPLGEQAVPASIERGN